MPYNVNANRLKIRAILSFTVFVNIAVVIIAYFAGQNLYWMLAASVPVLITVIYISQLQNTSSQHLGGFFKQIFFGKYLRLFRYNKVKEADLKLMIGNEQCRKPFNARFFNIATKELFRPSAFGNQLNEKHGSYYLVDDCRVWQIGPDYKGCKTEHGNFNCEMFKEQANSAAIKMIELNLLTQAYPSNSTNSEKNNSGVINRCNSIFHDESSFNVFRNAEAMILFLKTLRDLSGGKPVGVRLAPDNKKDFYSICHAICKTQIVPDFIVVEALADDIAMPHRFQQSELSKRLYESLLFVGETLRHYSIRSKIKIIASGKVTSALDVLKLVVLGANGVCASNAENNKKAAFFYSGERRTEAHRDLYRTTIDLMKSLKFTNLNDITLANFFSKLKIEQPENLGMQNNLRFFPDTALKPQIVQIKSFKTRDNNDTLSVLKKTQKEMSF
jgi:hypothetical protein